MVLSRQIGLNSRVFASSVQNSGRGGEYLQGHSVSFFANLRMLIEVKEISGSLQLGTCRETESSEGKRRLVLSCPLSTMVLSSKSDCCFVKRPSLALAVPC